MKPIKPIKLLTILISLLIILLPVTAPAESDEDLELINRPVNTFGLTGLLFTTSPFTLPRGTFEAGVATITEKSTIPDFSLNEIPSITASAGINDTMEIAARGSYFRRRSGDQGSTKQRGTGDTELSYKWNFLQQTESSSLPALALIVTGILPTSDREAQLPGVAHWGTRFGLSVGREITWADYVIGVYADGQLVLHDLSDPQNRDRYGIINAGIIFPVSKYRNLQMLVEYTQASGIDRADRVTPEGGDYAGITSGLRLVTERLNISFGTQFVKKRIPNFDNSTRLIAMVSIKL